MRAECGFRPPRAYRIWLRREDTWNYLVDHTQDAYDVLVSSLAQGLTRPLLQRRRTPDEQRARSTALVRATIGHFIQTLDPAMAVAAVGHRIGTKMDAGFVRVDAGLARVERKLDQFIDVQSKTNELVERRLRALES